MEFYFYFLKQPGCALIGACALIRTNVVLILMDFFAAINSWTLEEQKQGCLNIFAAISCKSPCMNPENKAVANNLVYSTVLLSVTCFSCMCDFHFVEFGCL